MKRENIEKAQQTASFIVAEIQAAHRDAIEAENYFAEIVLLGLIQEAATLAEKINAASKAAFPSTHAHTPQVWQIVRDGVTGEPLGYLGDGTVRITDGAGSYALTGTEQDAALIARAVNNHAALLTALKLVIPCVEYAEISTASDGLDEAHKKCLTALDWIRPVIAKAESDAETKCGNLVVGETGGFENPEDAKLTANAVNNHAALLEALEQMLLASAIGAQCTPSDFGRLEQASDAARAAIAAAKGEN